MEGYKLILHGALRAGVALVAAVAGTLAVDPISDTSPITIGLLIALVVTAFWVGMTLRGIQKDLLYVLERLDRQDERVDEIERRRVRKHPHEDDFPTGGFP